MMRLPGSGGKGSTSFRKVSFNMVLQVQSIHQGTRSARGNAYYLHQDPGSTRCDFYWDSLFFVVCIYIYTRLAQPNPINVEAWG